MFNSKDGKSFSLCEIIFTALIITLFTTRVISAQETNMRQGPPPPLADGQQLNPPPPPQGPKMNPDNLPQDKESITDQYNLSQAMSDQAQLHTIAFDGLAFITGSMGASTFLPPGKVADYFGFQYMRDIDVIGGHKQTFLTTIACNVYSILNDSQRDALISLGKEQAPVYKEFALKRLPLIQAYDRLLNNRLPAGKTGLDTNQVMKFTGELFSIDGKLSLERARVVAGIIKSLDDGQKAKLKKLKFGDSGTWPVMDEDSVFTKKKGILS